TALAWGLVTEVVPAAELETAALGIARRMAANPAHGLRLTKRLGAAAEGVRWVEADITKVRLPRHAYDLWHDRAVFHFLTTPEQRHAYVAAVLRAVKPGGHVIVSTFAEDGPLQCSGLPVMRYTADGLHAEFGASFELVRHEEEAHRTPSGGTQKFVYCYCRTRDS
ncbi:methyltransferase domain-containing protein, partial [Aromatoleum toluvorans]